MPIYNVGPKRLVVGAHYGLKDWIVQRVTAIVMAVFTVVLLVAYLVAGSATYEGWAGLFSNQLMKLLTFLVLISVFYHAWIGIRDIWMDYIKPLGIRLTLQILSVLYLLACAAYAVQILWKV